MTGLNPEDMTGLNPGDMTGLNPGDMTDLRRIQIQYTVVMRLSR